MRLRSNLGDFSISFEPPCNRDELLVRARSAADIEALSVRLAQNSNFRGHIIQSKDSGHVYLMIIPRFILSSLMNELLKEIDYGYMETTMPDRDFSKHYYRNKDTLMDENIKKIRRKVEDHLRKTTDPQDIIRVAQLLEIDISYLLSS